MAVTFPKSEQDNIVKPDDLNFSSFSIPGFTGPTEAAFPNTDVEKAPFLALLKMGAGSVLKRHYHVKAIESVYVVSGTLINDGVELPAGSFLVHGRGVVHGPHSTDQGCTLMFIQYPGVDVEDSIFVD